MKIRNNYVSNSSSSSFILEDIPALTSLTSKDWNEMLKGLYNNYEKTMESHRKFVKDYNVDDWMFPFCVFDLKTERNAAKKELGDLLESWNANLCTKVDGVVVKGVNEFPTEEWENYCESIEDRVECELRDKYDYVYVNCRVNDRDDIKEEYFDFRVYRNKKRCKAKFPKKYIKAMLQKWDSLGICTNLDVLMSDKARFAIHFDENEYCEIHGVHDHIGVNGWTTDSYSYQRLCEIFAKWLVFYKKVPANFTWQDLYDATLTFNMHEG